MATANPNIETRAEIKYICAADVSPKPIEWLWESFLPLGKMTLLAGPSGVGKSTILFDIAARVTTGEPWPDGSKGCAPGDVLIWSAEDEIDDTIVPRLMAAGANLQRIRFPDKVPAGEKERAFNPAIHMEKLRQDLRVGRRNTRLLVLDPIVSIISGNMNMANEVRNDLQPLVNLLRELGIAGTGISHLAKPSAGNPRNVTDSVIGSQAFTALPRMNWAANWSERHDAYVLAKGKQNITTAGGIKYSIVPATIPNPKLHKRISTTRIAWGDPVTEKADEIFRVKREDVETQKAVRQNPAATFLLERLPEGEEVPAKPLIELAAKRGISDDRLTRARNKLGISTQKTSNGAFYWSRPAKAVDASEERTP